VVLSWCAGCHHQALAAEDRAGAPSWGWIWTTHTAVQVQWAQVLATATGADAKMPPVGGPTDQERVQLAEWLWCGAP
jgi:hypothetical protein